MMPRLRRTSLNVKLKPRSEVSGWMISRRFLFMTICEMESYGSKRVTEETSCSWIAGELAFGQTQDLHLGAVAERIRKRSRETQTHQNFPYLRLLIMHCCRNVEIS